MRKVMIEVGDKDLDDFVERGIVRAEVARNAVLITENDDCVSRQAVMALLDKRYCHKEPYERKEGNTVYKGYDTYYMINFDKLKALPSVLPKRKQGEWCEQNDDYFDWYECSECGYGSEGEMQYSREHDVRTKYCPNCGSRNGD